MYLNVDEAKTINGANISINDGDLSKKQKFKFIKQNIVSLADGYYTIESSSISGKVLSLDNGLSNDGTNVKLDVSDNSNGQKWYIKNLGDGYYNIQSLLNKNRVLDVAGGLTVSGTNVHLWINNGSNGQKWFIKENEDGSYYLIAKNSNLYLNVSDSLNIQTDSYDASSNEKFALKKTSKTTSSKTLDEGSYIIESALKEEFNLDIIGGSTASNTNIQMHQTMASYRQVWDLQYISDGYYVIASHLDNNKVVDVTGGKSTALTNVHLWENNNSDGQKWLIRDAGDGYYYIVSKLDDMYLNVDGAKTINGANIEIYGGNEQKCQKFKFIKQELPVIEDGYYTINSVLDSSMVLSLNSSVSSNGVNAFLGIDTGLNSQKWYIKNLGNGYFSIQSGLNTNKILEAAGAGTVSGTNVQLYENTGKDSQVWYFKDAGDGTYYILAKHSSLYLDVAGGKAVNGANIQTYSSKRSSSQKFTLTKTELSQNVRTYDDGYYYFSSSLDNSKVIDVSGGYKTNGTNIQIYENNSSPGQSWYLTYLNNGYYKISSAMNPDTVMDVSGGNTAAGTNVHLWISNNSDGQQWYLKDLGDGKVSIISKGSGLYLDLATESTANRTNLQMNYGDNSASQIFTITKNNNEKVYTGIDVSYYQGSIDWQKIANSSLGFVIIRAGYGGDWSSQDDKMFEANVAACEKYNIPYGIYLYSYATTVSESTGSAMGEANHILRLIKKIEASGYSPNLGTKVYLDVEDSTQSSLGVSTLSTIADKFCTIIENNGYDCGIYANKTWLTTKLDTVTLAKKYDIWLAEWPNNINTHVLAKATKPTYNLTAYKLWQFASDGYVNGINGYVDMDLGYDIFD